MYAYRDEATPVTRGVRVPFASRRLGRSSVPGWLLVPVVIAAGMAMSKFVMEFPTIFIFALVGALVLGFVLIRNLQLGMLIYFFTAALALGETPGIQSPHSGYKAGLMPSQFYLAFLAFLWLLRAVLAGELKLAKSELNLPMAMLMAVSLTSLMANNILRSTHELLFHQMMITQIAEVGLLGCSACAFFLVANTLKERKWISRIFAPVVLLGLYHTAHRIVRYDFPVPMAWGSFLLAAALAFVYARLLFSKPTRREALSLGVLLVVLLYGAYSNLAWVSGWIAATIAILAVSWYRSKTLAALLVLLALIGIFVYPGIYGDLHAESEEGGDFDRFVIWADAFRMFMAVSPIIGVGPGNYHAYVYYHNTLWFGGGQTYTTAHSNYVQMAAELGLLGLAVFLWVIISAVKAGTRVARASPPEMQWLPVAATSFVIAMAVTSLFGDYLFPSRGNNGIVTFGTTVYTWLILGAAVALGNLPAESDQHEPLEGVLAVDR